MFRFWTFLSQFKTVSEMGTVWDWNKLVQISDIHCILHFILVNIEDKWHPELFHYCPETPMILVGNQVDLRDEAYANGSAKETE